VVQILYNISMNKRVFSLFLFAASFLGFGIDVLAQNQSIPLNTELNRKANFEIQKSYPATHTTMKPAIVFEPENKLDSLVFQPSQDKLLPEKIKKNWFYRKIRTEYLIQKKTEDFEIQIEPALNLEMGKDRETDSSFMINTRAVFLRGRIGKNVFFQSAFYENQATFPKYINNYVWAQKVVPGQGVRKEFGTTGHDFSIATGVISIFPFKNFNFQLGHDRQFVGDGYRSMLLSDNTYPYIFGKAVYKYKNFQYSWMLTEFQDFEREYYFYHHKKHGSFTMLSWKPTPKLELALFEAFIWHTGTDSTTKRFDISYFNPLILTKSAQFGLDNENNALLGLNAKYAINDYFQLYGQLAIDNLKLSDKNSYQNKLGYQLGAKCFDVFAGKLPKQQFYIQAELNSASPYTYASSTKYQHYSNLNQPLAHPLGAGFREIIGIARYSIWNFWAEGRFINAETSADLTNTNFGSNIFLLENPDLASTAGEYEHKIGQGNQSTIQHIQLKGGFLIKPHSNLSLMAGINIRTCKTGAITEKTNYFYIGLRTAITNIYTDF
jgi:hypothetical protein